MLQANIMVCASRCYKSEFFCPESNQSLDKYTKSSQTWQRNDNLIVERLGPFLGHFSYSCRIRGGSPLPLIVLTIVLWIIRQSLPIEVRRLDVAENVGDLLDIRG